MVVRYKCLVEYDGSSYYGFQRQSRKPTVQGEIERALSKAYGRLVEIHPASRTDRGVHATMQVFHYDVEDVIPEEKLQKVVNRILSDDVFIYRFEKVDNAFHARYDVKEKTYRYDIKICDLKSVFTERYALTYHSDLDIDYMREISKVFLGTRDFSAVMASGSDKKNTVRTIYDISIEKRDDVVSIYFTADGFLYNMVRIMLGAILDVVENNKRIEDLVYALEKGDRSCFKRTISPNGLYLVDIKY